MFPPALRFVSHRFALLRITTGRWEAAADPPMRWEVAASIHWLSNHICPICAHGQAEREDRHNGSGPGPYMLLAIPSKNVGSRCSGGMRASICMLSDDTSRLELVSRTTSPNTIGCNGDVRVWRLGLLTFILNHRTYLIFATLRYEQSKHQQLFEKGAASH